MARARERGAAALLAGLLLLGSGLAGYAAAPVMVTQLHRAFSTAAVRLARGGTVRFTNADEFLHQIYVKSDSFSFSSTGQEGGETLDVRFPVPGTFEVRCEIHPKMLLVVTVE